MKFYKLTEVSLCKNDRVFKVPPLGSLVATILLFSTAFTLLVIGFRGDLKARVDTPLVHPFFLWYLAAALAFIGLFTLGALRASLKPSNWLLRCNDKGLFIKYRSYRNWRLPVDDVQVLGLDYSEIAWAWEAKEWRNSPGLDGSPRREFVKYLDLGLANPDTALLEKHLESERARKWSSLWLHYPVEVLPGGIIRLQWKRNSNPAGALQWLSRHVRIAPPVSTKIDLTHQPGVRPDEEEGKIRQLLESGDKMGAVRLTREVYNCSLSEAMAHVEKMSK